MKPEDIPSDEMKQAIAKTTQPWTKKGFLHWFHNYQTQDEEEAKMMARVTNEIGIEGGEEAVAVHFEGLGYCVMLRSAITYLLEGAIVEDAEIVNENIVLKGRMKDDAN